MVVHEHFLLFGTTFTMGLGRLLNRVCKILISRSNIFTSSYNSIGVLNAWVLYRLKIRRGWGERTMPHCKSLHQLCHYSPLPLPIPPVLAAMTAGNDFSHNIILCHGVHVVVKFVMGSSTSLEIVCRLQHWSLCSHVLDGCNTWYAWQGRN